MKDGDNKGIVVVKTSHRGGKSMVLPLHISLYGAAFAETCNVICKFKTDFFHFPKWQFSIQQLLFPFPYNPTALRMAKTPLSFGHFECNWVKLHCFDQKCCKQWKVTSANELVCSPVNWRIYCDQLLTFPIINGLRVALAGKWTETVNNNILFVAVSLMSRGKVFQKLLTPSTPSQQVSSL